MNFNDETQTTPQAGPNQLSHVFYRHDLNDRDNHDQWHGGPGSAETEVTAQGEIMKPRLLDCFCGGGGAGYGYHLAGFEVVGVDIEPQKNYPFEFHQADALEFIAAHGAEFDVIHTSPPCEFGSEATPMANRGQHKNYIPELRPILATAGRPYVIENVENVRGWLVNPVMLCGSMFGLSIWRHRYFEISPYWFLSPAQCRHDFEPVTIHSGSNTDKLNRRTTANQVRAAMEIEWMTRDEVYKAIPPAYTEWLGQQLLRALAA